jgi:hypothetical protein
LEARVRVDTDKKRHSGTASRILQRDCEFHKRGQFGRLYTFYVKGDAGRGTGNRFRHASAYQSYGARVRDLLTVLEAYPMGALELMDLLKMKPRNTFPRELPESGDRNGLCGLDRSG